jgi:hypothetical protein
MTYCGHIRNGVAVLDEPSDLAEGTRVVVQPLGTFGFQENLSMPQLFDRQDVRPVGELADWPADESLDEFLSAVREGRR